VIVADTGAILALVDADERHHENLRRVFEDGESSWVVPWAVLPEIDYLLSTHVGWRAEEAFPFRPRVGSLPSNGGVRRISLKPSAICKRHRALRLGLVDSGVIAVAERLKAEAHRHARPEALRRREDPRRAEAAPPRPLSGPKSYGFICRRSKITVSDFDSGRNPRCAFPRSLARPSPSTRCARTPR